MVVEKSGSSNKSNGNTINCIQWSLHSVQKLIFPSVLSMRKNMFSNIILYFLYISDIFSDGFKFGTGKKVLSAVIKHRKRKNVLKILYKNWAMKSKQQ